MQKNEQYFIADITLNWVRQEIADQVEKPLEESLRGPDLELNRNITLNKFRDTLVSLFQHRPLFALPALARIHAEFSHQELSSTGQHMMELLALITGKVSPEKPEEEKPHEEPAGFFNQGIFKLMGDNDAVHELVESGNIDAVEKMADSHHAYKANGGYSDIVSICRQQIYRALHRMSKDGAARLERIVNQQMEAAQLPSYLAGPTPDFKDEFSKRVIAEDTTTRDPLVASILSCQIESGPKVELVVVMDLADMAVARFDVQTFVHLLPLIVEVGGIETGYHYLQRMLKDSTHAELLLAAKGLMIRLLEDDERVMAAVLAATIGESIYREFAVAEAEKHSTYLAEEYPKLKQEMEQYFKENRKAMIIPEAMRKFQDVESELWELAVKIGDVAKVKQCIAFRIDRNHTHELGNRLNRMTPEERKLFNEQLVELRETLKSMAREKARNPYINGRNQMFHEVRATILLTEGEQKLTEFLLELLETTIPAYLRLEVIYHQTSTALKETDRVPESLVEHVEKSCEADGFETVDKLLTLAIDRIEDAHARGRVKFYSSLIEQFRISVRKAKTKVELIERIIAFSRTQAGLTDVQRKELVDVATGLVWSATIANVDTFFNEILKEIAKCEGATGDEIVEMCMPYVVALMQKGMLDAAQKFFGILRQHIDFELDSEHVSKEYWEWLLANNLLKSLTIEHQPYSAPVGSGIDSPLPRSLS